VSSIGSNFIVLLILHKNQTSVDYTLQSEQQLCSHDIRTAINRQYSASNAYCIRLAANPSISFFSSTGDCPVSLSSATVVSVTHLSVYGAGTTSVNGQQNGGFICQYTEPLPTSWNSIEEILLSQTDRSSLDRGSAQSLHNNVRLA